MGRVACWQVRVEEGEEITARMERVLSALEQFASPVDLVVLPEMWTVGFFHFSRWPELAELLDGPFVTSMRNAARKRGVYLIPGSFVERQGGHLFNTTLLIDPRGKVLAWYRKMHLFRYRSREAELLSPGREPVVVETPLGSIGLSICYDLRFPELYREMVFRGAEILVVLATWPAVRIEHWLALNVARAIENQCYVVAVNGVGTLGRVPVGGCTMVVDPTGKVLARASAENEEVLLAELDREQLLSLRREFPVLEDSRVSGISWRRGSQDDLEGNC